jgi:tetratricopeptide (TPR) repeat protein
MRWWGKRAVTVTGNVGAAVTGDKNRIVNQFLLASPRRSAYWEHVHEIVPAELVGREGELAELAAFCTAASGPSYAWWRAEAWAGKSALMSWFALNPPPGIRVVAFFVTARDGGYNHVGAYVDNVLEQLAELVGEGLPHLTEGTRRGHLLRLYREAAWACARREERLVVLLDGLDEDRGVTTGSAAHSIASLLPPRPEAGMRVLVTGRLNPPLPSDVASQHQLRQAVIRRLEPSPYAQVVRGEAERELKRLREAGGLEYELLAVVTAADGGLTTEDLAELTGAARYDVQDTLNTYAGRTFRTRAGTWLLAHDGLQSRAEEMLGDTELARFRDSLHIWADGWRAQGWPPGTPGYLLRGYFQRVLDLGDLTRAVRCALDASRHDRMLAVTGADGSALEEIHAAERLLAEVITSGVDPDTEGASVPPFPDLVLSLFKLSLHSDAIKSRNHGFTEAFAWAWAALGQPSRAEAVARSLASLHRTPALAMVAQELAEQGLIEQARELADAAETALSKEVFWHLAAEHSVVVHRALVGVGLSGRADALRISAHPFSDEQPAPRIVRTWVEHEEYERARAVVIGQTNPSHRSACLRSLVTALLAKGQIEPAFEAVREAGNQAPSSTVLRLALALSHAGRLEEADALLGEAPLPWSGFLDDAIKLAEAAADTADYLSALVEGERWDVLRDWLRIPDDKAVIAEQIGRAMAPWLVRRGDLDRAEAILNRQPDEEVSEAACLLAEALARRGEVDRVSRFAGGLSSAATRSKVLASAAEGCVATGRLREAESLAELSGYRGGLDPLARGAVAWARSGHREEAAAFLARVEDRARREATARRSVSDRARVAHALAAAGFTAAAREVLARIEEALEHAPSTEEPDSGYGYDEETADVVLALVRAGEIRRADALICTPGRSERAGEEAWAAVVRAWTEAGQEDQAETLVRDARGGPYEEELLAERATALAGRGDAARAADCASAVRHAPSRISAMARTARALALNGLNDESRAMLSDLPQKAGSPALGEVPESALVLTEVFQAWSALGEQGRARAVAREAMRFRKVGTTLHTGWRIVRALVRAGLHDEAKWFVRSIPPGDAHETARRGLAQAFAEAGETTAALNWIRPLDDYVEVAVTLVSAIDPTQGRALAVHALRHGDWQEALPAVLHLAPSAVPFLVEVFRHAPTAARTSAPSWTKPLPAPPAAPASPPPSAPCTAGPGSTPSSPGPDR